MSLIELNGIRRIFKRGDEEIAALDGINLAIEPGDFLAITGTSGSGKSTLLYIIGLLDSPSAGSYRLEGKEVSTLNDNELSQLRNLKLGFVFQSFHLLPRVSALRNVCMPLVYGENYGHRLSNAEQVNRATEALERVGLKDRMQHVPNELSGGQRQRVAIARALINNPPILLADEPTGNLDSKNGRAVLGLLQELNSSGVTIILVTHDAEIASQAKRCIFMKDGRIDAIH